MQPIEVIANRTILRGTTQVKQVLVQWENGIQDDATWEDIEDIKANYPSFNLEDKVDVKGEGNVMGGKTRAQQEPNDDVPCDEEGMNNKFPKNVDLGRRKRVRRPTWKLRN